MTLHLKEAPLLKDFQSYVQELENERGFSEQSTIQKCLLLGEELGELFKAIRKQENIRIEKNAQVGSVSEELADLFIFICSIANRYDIDLETAFREKEEINKNRTWQ